MKNIVLKKINELKQEGGELTRIRESLANKIQNIDIRLTQIVGAVSTMEAMVQEADATEGDQLDIPSDHQESSLPPQ